MNVSKAAVYLLLLLLVTAVVPAHVWGQSGAPGTKLRASVLRDTETMVASASRWRYHEGEAQVQCTPNGIPALAGCGKSRSVVLPAQFVAFCTFVTR